MNRQTYRIRSRITNVFIQVIAVLLCVCLVAGTDVYAAGQPNKITTLVDDLVLYNDANIQDGDVTELTPLETWRSGSAWYRKKLNTKDGFSVEFSYWAGGGREDTYGGADGIALQFSKTMGLGEQGEYLGFKEGSVGVELDSYFGNPGDPGYKHIGIIENRVSNHICMAEEDRVDDSQWHDLKVDYDYDNSKMVVLLDGAEVLSSDEIVLPEWVYVGLSAATGSGFNRHMIRNFSIEGVFLESDTFVLGRDNNSFCHYASNDPQSGFYGIHNHGMDLDYLKALAKDSDTDAGGIASMLLNVEWPMDGWCFGIAATMGLVHDKQIEVKTITSDTAGTYFEMSPPYLNYNLKNAINYYFEAQHHISAGTGFHATIPPGMISGDVIRVSDAAMNFHDFLKGIVKAAQVNDLVFGYPGHAVLITDCIKHDDNTYTLIVFDENSVSTNNPYGAFGTIDIDISSFKMEYTNYKGELAISSEESENADLYYASTSQIAGSTKEGIRTAEKRSLLKIPRNKPVKIVDKNGNIMIETIDGKIISKVPVFDLKMLAYSLAGDESDEQTEYVVLEIDRIDGITVESESYDNIEVSLTDSDNTARLSGYFTKATLDMKEGISVEGEAEDFYAGLSSGNAEDPGSTKVVVASGSWSDCLNVNKVSEEYPFDISADGFSDPEVELYDGDGFVTVDNIEPYDHNYIDGSGNATTEINEEPVHQHSFTEWTVVRPATELAAGEEIRTCTECGEEETQQIAKLAPTLKSVKISKPKAAKKSAIIKWKKVSKNNLKKIKKIQIQYSTDKKFRKGVKTKYVSAKKTSYKIKKLKKGKKYYVRIRAYTKSGKTVHISKWSKTKTVKAK